MLTLLFRFTRILFRKMSLRESHLRLTDSYLFPCFSATQNTTENRSNDYICWKITLTSHLIKTTSWRDRNICVWISKFAKHASYACFFSLAFAQPFVASRGWSIAVRSQWSSSRQFVVPKTDLLYPHYNFIEARPAVRYNNEQEAESFSAENKLLTSFFDFVWPCFPCVWISVCFK